MITLIFSGNVVKNCNSLSIFFCFGLKSKGFLLQTYRAKQAGISFGKLFIANLLAKQAGIYFGVLVPLRNCHFQDLSFQNSHTSNS